MGFLWGLGVFSHTSHSCKWVCDSNCQYVDPDGSEIHSDWFTAFHWVHAGVDSSLFLCFCICTIHNVAMCYFLSAQPITLSKEFSSIKTVHKGRFSRIQTEGSGCFLHLIGSCKYLTCKHSHLQWIKTRLIILWKWIQTDTLKVHCMVQLSNYHPTELCGM